MINPRATQVYIPTWMGGSKRLMLQQLAKQTGRKMTSSAQDLAALPREVLPWVCCTGELGDLLLEWKKTNRPFVYWDRGYLRRVGGLFQSNDGSSGFWRVNESCFQMQRIRDVPPDRWNALKIAPSAWHKGRNIIVATTNSMYWDLHKIDGWLDKTLVTLREHTDRPVVVRQKNSHIPLYDQLFDAHCLVTHGSNVAIEAVILGCPVIVDKSSAASLVGITDITKVEEVVYPDREPWLYSLAYSQYTEPELVSGTVWSLIDEQCNQVHA